MNNPSAQVKDIEQHDTLLSTLKFLVCVNKGEASRVALRFACIKAKKRGGLVDILHVMEPPDFQSLSGVADKMQEERRQEAEALLKRLADEAHECSGITPTLLVREGKIEEEILKAAVEDIGVTMLVLGVNPGSPNRGKLIAWLSTHMGQEVLVPIMLVPGNLTDQQIEELS